MVIQTGKERDDRLRRIASNGFLAQLREAVRLYGDESGDYEALKDFVSHLYQLRGYPVPDLEPHLVIYGEER